VARSVAVSTIMTRARRWANMERDTDFVTDAELIEYVDSAWTRLYKLYVAAWPERFQSEASVATVNGTAAYALPATWFGTVGVDVSEGGTYRALRPLQEEERNTYQTAGAPVGFRVVGDNLVVYPTPSSALALRHIYVPTATPITSSATTIDGVLGHERLLELDVAIRLKAKEEANADDLVRQHAELKLEIEEEAQMRLVRSPQKIAIVEGRELPGTVYGLIQ
jgi:hypothetical protein